MSKKIRVLIANNNRDSLISIKKLFQNMDRIKVTGEAKNGSEAVEMCINFQPDIIIMSAAMPLMDGFAAAMKISQIAPYIGIVLVGTINSVEVMHKAMQCGVSDFLEPPLTLFKLESTLYSLYDIKQKQREHLLQNPLIIPQREPKVISVFSSKGGVGKSVLSTNIAVSLREQTHEDVLLIDLDLQFGDISEMLDVSSRTSIVELMNDKDNIEISEIDKYTVTHFSGIKILPAPQKPEQADIITDDSIKQIVSFFLKAFDYIIIDLPPIFNSVTLSAIELSDYLLMVTTMEVPTLKNVKSGLEVLYKLDYPKDKITIVLNRYSENRDIKLEDIKRFLSIEKLFCIDDNPDLVISSINTGEPIIIRYKDIPISKQITLLSKNMIEYKRFFKAKKKSLFEHIINKGD